MDTKKSTKKGCLIAIGCIVVSIWLFVRACDTSIIRAHSLNEDGIELFQKKEYSSARKMFEESIGFSIREYIPAYNLARCYYEEKDFSAAHQEYERAIELRPNYTEAYFNDGHALYQWGLQEIDPDFCTIDRGIELLQKAADRFQTVIDLSRTISFIHRNAVKNKEFIVEQIVLIKQKHEENKVKCKSGGGASQPQSQSENKNESQPSKEENDPKSDSESGSLSGEEKEDLSKELERVKKEGSENSFNQTKPQQLRQGEGRENVDDGIYW